MRLYNILLTCTFLQSCMLNRSTVYFHTHVGYNYTNIYIMTVYINASASRGYTNVRLYYDLVSYNVVPPMYWSFTGSLITLCKTAQPTRIMSEECTISHKLEEFCHTYTRGRTSIYHLSHASIIPCIFDPDHSSVYCYVYIHCMTYFQLYMAQQSKMLYFIHVCTLAACHGYIGEHTHCVLYSVRFLAQTIRIIHYLIYILNVNNDVWIT